MPDISPVYRPRKPQDSLYYQCVEDHFEMLEQVYDERFAKQYGFFRPYVKQGLRLVLRQSNCRRPARHRELRRGGRVFQHNVFKMLLSKGKITQELVDMLMSWPPARRAYASESAIRDSTFIVDQGSNRVMTTLWKTWPGISSGPPSPRRE